MLRPIVGVADRTLKTFNYISKGLLPSDDARARRPSRNGTREEQILYACWMGWMDEVRRKNRVGGLKKEGKGKEISVKLSFSYVIVVIRFREEDWLLLLQCLWSAQLLFIGRKQPMPQYPDTEKKDG